MTSNKADFKARKVISDKEGHYILMRLTLQKDVILNVHASNRLSNYMRQKLMETGIIGKY